MSASFFNGKNYVAVLRASVHNSPVCEVFLNVEFVKNVKRKSSLNALARLSKKAIVKIYIIPIGGYAVNVSLSCRRVVRGVIRIHNKRVQNARFLKQVSITLN